MHYNSIYNVKKGNKYGEYKKYIGKTEEFFDKGYTKDINFRIEALKN